MLTPNTTKRKATINDVARLAGIGKATASRALSGNGSTAPATREAVLRVAQELNFEVNPLARSLSCGRSQTLVGLFALNLDLGIGTQKVQLIQQLLGAAGYDVPLYAYSMLTGSHFVEQGNLLRALCRQRPRAIVFKSGNLDAQSLDALREYAAEGGVLVSYNHPSNLDCDQVVFDEAAAMQRAVEYLAALGHRRIGLRQHGTPDKNALTYKGFRAGLKAANLEFRPDWVWHEGSYEEGGFLLAEAFLKLPSQERPTAICVLNDASASAFVGEMARRGQDVPQTVSVVGFGDMPAARFGLKPLTTVAEPVAAIAARVTDLLRERIEENYAGPPHRTVFCGDLVVRETTASPDIQYKP
jgi:DNA-binding LacI/PurR family transcriptional regulator